MTNQFENPAVAVELDAAQLTPEEKRKKINELKTIWKEKRDEVADDAEQLGGRDLIRANFVAGLESKYGRKVHDHELYYLIAQKTAPANCQYFDLPGEDSVDKFITEKL